MATTYDPERIRRFYNAYGDREWQRFSQAPHDLVNFFIHTHYLKTFITSGMHVLDAGAGPGRFTIELARLGTRVTVGDISDGMLEQNRVRLQEAGFEAAVIARERLDITDLSSFPDDAFDATVCYGGPLSYVMDKADVALAELLRVTKPGGYLLLSVMSTVGATRASLPFVLEVAEQYGLGIVGQVLQTGLLTGEFNRGHAMKMYRWTELQTLLERHPCRVVAASAANYLSVGHEDALSPLLQNPKRWEAFLAWELRCCQEPGARDGGTHILAVIQKHSYRNTKSQQ
jgi:ubiquinone/menaquinone biosynthesis C-methylase UbiE